MFQGDVTNIETQDVNDDVQSDSKKVLEFTLCEMIVGDKICNFNQNFIVGHVLNICFVTL